MNSNQAGLDATHNFDIKTRLADLLRDGLVCAIGKDAEEI